MGEEIEVEVRGPNGVWGRLELCSGAPRTLGRSRDVDLTISAGSVSARHAELRLHEGRLEVRDLASRWGTFVGEERVESWTPVGDGTLWLGDAELLLVAQHAPVPALVAVTSSPGTAPAARRHFSLRGDASDRIGGGDLGALASALPTGVLPLRFVRRDGLVVAIEDAAARRYDLPASIGDLAFTLLDEEDSLASIVIPLDERPKAAAAADAPVESGDRAVAPEEDENAEHAEVGDGGSADRSAKDGRTATGPSADATTVGRRRSAIELGAVALALLALGLAAMVLWSIR